MLRKTLDCKTSVVTVRKVNGGNAYARTPHPARKASSCPEYGRFHHRLGTEFAKQNLVGYIRKIDDAGR